MSSVEKKIIEILDLEMESLKRVQYKPVKIPGSENRELIDKLTLVLLRYETLKAQFLRDSSGFKVEKITHEIKQQKYIAALNTFFEGKNIPRENPLRDKYEDELENKRKEYTKTFNDLEELL